MRSSAKRRAVCRTIKLLFAEQRIDQKVIHAAEGHEKFTPSSLEHGECPARRESVESSSLYNRAMAKAAETAANEKLEAAERAAGLVESGMVVGLGSGTTASLAVRALGRRVAAGLDIIGVPTSENTAALARELGIRLSDLAQHERIDLTIDGADEVERGSLHLVKGLGGALLREKIVASATARLVIVADESKVVERLRIAEGPIPVEVAVFGWQSTARRLRAIRGEFRLRLGGRRTALCFRRRALHP